jgi:hypothetical protein
VLLITLYGLPLVTCDDNGCHPQCSYLCDDPLCKAICKVISSTPNCTISCSNNYVPRNGFCDPLNCITRSADTDVCEMESCPQVETICMPPVCRRLPPGITCSPLCLAPVAYWHCTKPTQQECPLPRCELLCENYPCKSTNPPSNNSIRPMTGVLSCLILMLIYTWV